MAKLIALQPNAEDLFKVTGLKSVEMVFTVTLKSWKHSMQKREES